MTQRTDAKFVQVEGDGYPMTAGGGRRKRGGVRQQRERWGIQERKGHKIELWVSSHSGNTLDHSKTKRMLSVGRHSCYRRRETNQYASAARRWCEADRESYKKNNNGGEERN